MGRRSRWLSVGAGVLLAGHFACFIPAVSLTTVASAVALVAMQPAWAALILRARGERMAGQAWLGVGLAIGGAFLLSGVDVTVSGRALFGDVLALVGGALAAAYRVVGAEVRRTVSTTAYTAVCYPVAAVVLLAVCLVSGSALGGYPASTWLRLAALALLAQLLGHSVFNLVLKTVSPTIVSVALLFEIVGAAAPGRGVPRPEPARGGHPGGGRHRPRHVPRHPLRRVAARRKRRPPGRLTRSTSPAESGQRFTSTDAVRPLRFPCTLPSGRGSDEMWRSAASLRTQTERTKRAEQGLAGTAPPAAARSTSAPARPQSR